MNDIERVAAGPASTPSRSGRPSARPPTWSMGACHSTPPTRSASTTWPGVSRPASASPATRSASPTSPVREKMGLPNSTYGYLFESTWSSSPVGAWPWTSSSPPRSRPRSASASRTTSRVPASDRRGARRDRRRERLVRGLRCAHPRLEVPVPGLLRRQRLLGAHRALGRVGPRRARSTCWARP